MNSGLIRAWSSIILFALIAAVVLPLQCWMIGVATGFLILMAAACRLEPFKKIRFLWPTLGALSALTIMQVALDRLGKGNLLATIFLAVAILGFIFSVVFAYKSSEKAA
jgi:hypothetical protein